MTARDRQLRDLEGTFERRAFAAGLELREAGETVHFSGYASTFSVPYAVGDFTEEIAPGAFKRTLSETSLDTVLNLDHGRGGSGLPLARTKSGTLSLVEDTRGLKVDADLDRTDPDVQAVRPKLARGDLSEMSFAFLCTADSWNEDRSHRTVRGVSLHRGDVSIVTTGANGDTTATMRSLELRALAKYSVGERAEMAATGEALPDGSFPIRDREDLKNAVRLVGLGTNHSTETVRRHIMRRAHAIGAAELVPANWNATGTARSAVLDYTTEASQQLDLVRLGSAARMRHELALGALRSGFPAPALDPASRRQRAELDALKR